MGKSETILCFLHGAFDSAVEHCHSVVLGDLTMSESMRVQGNDAHLGGQMQTDHTVSL